MWIEDRKAFSRWSHSVPGSYQNLSNLFERIWWPRPLVFEWLMKNSILSIKIFPNKPNISCLTLRMIFLWVRHYTRLPWALFCFIIFKVLVLLCICAIIFLGLEDVTADRTLSYTDFLSLGTCLVWSLLGLIIFIVPAVTNNSVCSIPIHWQNGWAVPWKENFQHRPLPPYISV